LRPHPVEVGAGGSLYVAGPPVDDREEWRLVAEVGVHAGHPRAGDARAFPFGELAHDLPGHILLPGGGQVTGQVGAEPVLELGFDYGAVRSEEHTSELQSREKLVCRLLLEI